MPIAYEVGNKRLIACGAFQYNVVEVILINWTAFALVSRCICFDAI